VIEHHGRRSDDEAFSVGELARLLATLTVAVERLEAEVRGLSTAYVPREVHDLAVGGVKVDIRRIDETQDKTDRRLDDIAKTIDKRFAEAAAAQLNTRRWAVSAVVIPLIAILVSLLGIVLVVLP
jgi:hypothetical protein